MPLTPAIVSAGAVATGGTLGTAAAPTFGASTTAHNLLVAHVKATRGTSGGNFTCSDGTWTRAVQNVARGQVQSAIWYKADCAAGETAPTFNYSNSAVIHAQLREFSGCKRVSPLDRTAGADGAGSVVNSPDITATCAGADTASPTVVVTADAFSFNSNYSHASGDTYNNGATPTGPNNDAVSNRDHYRFGYGITTGNSGADTQEATSDQVGTASVASTCIATFKAAAGTQTTPGSFALTGTSAGAKRALKATTTVPAMAITGAAANLPRALKTSATPGAVVLTGIAAVLSRGFKASATPGSMLITGIAATITRGYKMNATPGSVLITGIAAILQRAYYMSATHGSITLTGADADLIRALYLAAAAGAVDVTGDDLVIVRGKAMQASPGAIAITGEDINALRALTAILAPDTVVITGNDAALSYGFRVSALAGGIVIVGFDATSQLIDVFPGGTPGLLIEARPGRMASTTRGRLAETTKG